MNNIHIEALSAKQVTDLLTHQREALQTLMAAATSFGEKVLAVQNLPDEVKNLVPAFHKICETIAEASNTEIARITSMSSGNDAIDMLNGYQAVPLN